MLRSQLPFVVLLTWLAQPLELAGQIQVPHADSAHYTQARALCGPLADDTTGRIEPGTIKVAATPHEDFVPAVQRYLNGARFAPGRIHGRLMRVCIVMPISFSLPER